MPGRASPAPYPGQEERPGNYPPWPPNGTAPTSSSHRGVGASNGEVAGSGVPRPGNERLSPRDVRYRHQRLPLGSEDVIARRWSDLSERSRGLIIAAAIGEAVLKTAVLIDIGRRPASQIRGSKRMWIIAAVLVNSAGVGPLSYFAFGRRP